MDQDFVRRFLYRNYFKQQKKSITNKFNTRIKNTSVSCILFLFFNFWSLSRKYCLVLFVFDKLELCKERKIYTCLILFSIQSVFPSTICLKIYSTENFVVAYLTVSLGIKNYSSFNYCWFNANTWMYQRRILRAFKAIEKFITQNKALTAEWKHYLK